MAHQQAVKSFHQQISVAGALVAMGIVFGDIGTSPLYTLNAVFHERVISEAVALGSLSAIFWTLVLQTTIKYVIITLQADNHGEGGILSLYALIRRYWGKWLVFPAIAGAAFLLADGIITPPISVASAVEGLQKEFPDLNTMPIVLALLTGLFLFQQFGTERLGKIFGPVMLVWFTCIGGLGLWALQGQWVVFKALNPYYAWYMLTQVPDAFWLLGSIFLCTTGAEALYSDMGHCGRNNIRVSWSYIKICLVLSYAGQTAWLISQNGKHLDGVSPFFHIVPDMLYWPVLAIATLATIIASQALISGCFTLINEAIRLDLWPKHLVLFPSNIKGQLYIPAINWGLMAGCLAMVLYFKKSTAMEAAFGLSVTLTMLMSTVLVNFYLHARRWPFAAVVLITGLFLAVEVSFLIANLQKIAEGGWITLALGFGLFMVMFIWQKGKQLKSGFTPFVHLKKYLPLLDKLSNDAAIPKFATNLVYLTSSADARVVEKPLIDSILHTGIPKRADVYWLIHMMVLDDPFALRYEVEKLVDQDIYYVTIKIGFRNEPNLEFYLKQIVKEMVQSGELHHGNRCEEQYQENPIGDFRFVVMDSFLSYEDDLPAWKNFVMKSFYNLKKLGVRTAVNFGLNRNTLVQESHPLVVSKPRELTMVREGV